LTRYANISEKIVMPRSLRLVREKDGSTYWVGIDGKRVAEVDESAD